MPVPLLSLSLTSSLQPSVHTVLAVAQFSIQDPSSCDPLAWAMRSGVKCGNHSKQLPHKQLGTTPFPLLLFPQFPSPPSQESGRTRLPCLIPLASVCSLSGLHSFLFGAFCGSRSPVHVTGPVSPLGVATTARVRPRSRPKHNRLTRKRIGVRPTLNVAHSGRGTKKLHLATNCFQVPNQTIECGQTQLSPTFLLSFSQPQEGLSHYRHHEVLQEKRQGQEEGQQR